MSQKPQAGGIANKSEVVPVLNVRESVQSKIWRKKIKK